MEMYEEVEDERLSTPILEAVGLPLPMIPLEAISPFAETRQDYHHNFHPRKSQQLQDVGGLAVRYCRGEMLPRWQHNQYHHIFSGPELPQSDAEKFKTVVLACAGWVPRQAIVLDTTRSDRHYMRHMDSDELERVVHTDRIGVEHFWRPDGGRFERNGIGRFFAAYASSQDLGHISQSVISEFVDTKNDVRRRELGNLLLQESIAVSLDPVKRFFQAHEDTGMVRVRHTDAATTVRKFFSKRRFSDYYDMLTQNFETSNGCISSDNGPV